MSVNAPEKGLTPLILPVILLGTILTAAFLLGHLLLNLHPRIATFVALMMAFNLLAFFSFMSWRLGKADAIEKVLALGVTLVPILLGVAIVSGIVNVKGEGHEGTEGGPVKVTLVAKDLKFDKSEIELVAGKENELDLDNKDTQPHNVIVYNGPDEKSPALSDGQPIANPGQRVAYHVTPPAPGTYFFHCQIHPAQMTGKAIVKEGAGGAEAAAGAGGLAISAKDLKFDKAELTAKVGEEVTIKFDNKDTQPHNIQVHDGPDATAPALNDGQPFTNPGQKVDYKIKAATTPGNKFFYCQIHPIMKGTYVVQ
jgi:plastocyanin